MSTLDKLKRGMAIHRLHIIAIQVNNITTIDMADPKQCVLGHSVGHEMSRREAQEYFHGQLSDEQLWELFGPAGCNDAKTGPAAAKYIEDFITRHFTKEIA